MLHALDATRPGLFDVDFALTPRRDQPWWRIWSVFEKRDAVVDGWAIGQAVRHAIGRCNTFTVSGKRQVWNEYRLFLHPADLDRVRPAVPHMVRELGELIREEIARHEAHTIGRIEVRLLSDGSRSIPPGRAQLACGLREDGEDVQREDGETTLRFDAQGRGSVRDHARSGEATLPSSAVVVRGGGQVVHLPEGRTVVLGRAADPNPPDHLTVPGATLRVSRRHLEVCVEGVHVRVTALPDAATSVHGRPLAAAEAVVFTLAPGVPVPLVLANEVHLDLERVR